jgi:hypothetical protein
LSEPTENQVGIVFANSFQVHYSKADFHITLAVETPNGKRPLLGIFLSPEGTKTLLRILEVNVGLYEETHRKIDEPKLITDEDKTVQQEKPIYR